MATTTDQLRAVARAAGGTAAVNAFAMLIGVGTGVVSAQALAPTDRGVFIAIVLWTNTIAAFAMLGADHAIIYQGRGSWDVATASSMALRVSVRRQAMVAGVIAALVNTYLMQPKDPGSFAIALAAAGVVPLNAFCQLRLSPLLAASRVRQWNLLRVSSQVAYLLLSLMLLASGAFTVVTGLVALIVGNALTTLLCFIFQRRERAAVDTTVDVAGLRSYGRRLVLVTIPGFLGQRVDQLIMGVLAAPAQLGVYAVAVSVASMADVVRLTIEQIAFPKFAANVHLRRRARRLSFASTASVLLAGLLLWPFVGSLISLVYGDEYRSAVQPLFWLGVAAAVRVGIAVMNAAAKAENQLSVMAKAQVAAVTTTSAGLILLLPWKGMTGAALSVLAGQAVALALMWPALQPSRMRADDSH